MPQIILSEGRGSKGIYPPIPASHRWRASPRDVNSLALAACYLAFCSSGMKALQCRLAVGRHLELLEVVRSQRSEQGTYRTCYRWLSSPLNIWGNSEAK